MSATAVLLSRACAAIYYVDAPTTPHGSPTDRTNAACCSSLQHTNSSTSYCSVLLNCCMTAARTFVCLSHVHADLLSISCLLCLHHSGKAVAVSPRRWLPATAVCGKLLYQVQKILSIRTIFSTGSNGWMIFFVVHATSSLFFVCLFIGKRQVEMVANGFGFTEGTQWVDDEEVGPNFNPSLSLSLARARARARAFVDPLGIWSDILFSLV